MNAPQPRPRGWAAREDAGLEQRFRDRFLGGAVGGQLVISSQSNAYFWSFHSASFHATLATLEIPFSVDGYVRVICPWRTPAMILQRLRKHIASLHVREPW